MVPSEPLSELSCIEASFELSLEDENFFQPSWLMAQDSSCPGCSICQRTQCV